MKDNEKSKQQLVDESAKMRQLIHELETKLADRTLQIEVLSNRIVELESQLPSASNPKIQVCGLDVEWHPEKQFLLANLPVVMMWIDTTLASFMAGVQAMIGTERFVLVLQSEGRKGVVADWEFMSQFPSFPEGFKELSKLAYVGGWGHWELISLDWEQKECRFRVEKCWEARYQQALGVCWGSAMVAGKLAGYCTKLFHTNCWAEQTSFAAKGDRFDEFFVHPSNRSIEEEIDKLLLTDEATRADMAVALQKLRREIGERQRIEEELRESEQRFRATFEQAAVGIAHVGIDGRWLRVNQKLCDIVGYTREEILTLTFQEITHPDDLDKQLEYIHQLWSGQIQNYSLEKRYIRKDKSIVWIDLTVSMKRSSDGNPNYTIALVQDISDRKLAQAELDRFFRLSLDMLAVASMNDGYFKRLNPAWEKTLGYSLEQLLAEPFLNFIHPEDKAASITQLENLNSGATLFNFENRFRCQNGDYKWLAWTAVPVLPEGLIYCVGRDITERKEVESNLRNSEARERAKSAELERTLEELKQAQAKLIHSEKMSSLGQLLAGIAHEINNPVNFIYGNLCHASEYTSDLLAVMQLYQQEYSHPSREIQEESEQVDLEFLMEDLPKLISSMKVGADRIREIVLSLKNFSRLDEGQMKTIDIHEGIDSTLTILHNRLKHRGDNPGVQIIKEYGNLPLIECYSGQLNQVFMNIITNAIDALEEQKNKKDAEQKDSSNYQLPSIRIRTELIDNLRIAIRIADNGPGMNEQVRKHLFDPFFTTKPIGVGTGLGLSISYQIIVDKHHGKLQCFSEEGKGTEFAIEIPIHH